MNSLKVKVGESGKNTIHLAESNKPQLTENQVLIKVKAAALNRRDQWIRMGMYPKIQEAILGSDAAGIVEEVFDTKDEHWLAKSVVINPNNHWGEDPRHQSNEYHILGMPSDGTFAEYIAVDVNRLHEKPAHLTFEQAAALPLGGLTAYRAVFTQGKIQKNDKVLISGVGGGVAQFAFQFAKAAGASVCVSSSDDEKLNKTKELGADFGVNYKNEGWQKEISKQMGELNLIIDSAGGEQFSTLIKLLGRSGKLVFYGATLGLPPKIDLYRMFFNQISIQGTTMGNDIEFEEMLNFVSKHQIAPIIDSVRPFNEIISAFDKMQNSEHFGKLVISM
jgi:NADPH:quinone reductase-like Zn-dependent oxidoreductase